MSARDFARIYPQHSERSQNHAQSHPNLSGVILPKTYSLTDPDGPSYTEEQVREIPHLRDPGTLPSWRKAGTAPPFFRFGQIVRYRREDLDRFVHQRLVDPERHSPSGGRG